MRAPGESVDPAKCAALIWIVPAHELSGQRPNHSPRRLTVGPLGRRTHSGLQSLFQGSAPRWGNGWAFGPCIERRISASIWPLAATTSGRLG